MKTLKIRKIKGNVNRKNEEERISSHASYNIPQCFSALKVAGLSAFQVSSKAVK